MRSLVDELSVPQFHPRQRVAEGVAPVLPVLAYLTAQNRVRQPIDDLRVWLTQNNSTVMAVLLLVIGVTILGKGLAGIL